MQVKIASNEVIHFVGIGGIGMSGLAQIMHNMDDVQLLNLLVLEYHIMLFPRVILDHH